jgi:uncharacterized protein
MISGKATAVGEVIVARRGHGEDLLESIAQLCRHQEIRNGVILMGSGSVDRARFMGARSPAWPNRDCYHAERKEGLEILSITGVIADYDVHAHVVLANPDRAIGGHIESGCRVLSFCELVIARLEGIELKRVPDPVLKQPMLQVLPSVPPAQQDLGPWARAPETIG